jgi:hypothetical protein
MPQADDSEPLPLPVAMECRKLVKECLEEIKAVRDLRRDENDTKYDWMEQVVADAFRVEISAKTASTSKKTSQTTPVAQAASSSKSRNVNVDMDDVGGWIYALRESLHAGYVKIGYTIDLKSRTKPYQTAMPGDVLVIHKIKCINYVQVEPKLHNILSSLKRGPTKPRGEWFELKDEEAVYLLKTAEKHIQDTGDHSLEAFKMVSDEKLPCRRLTN